MSEPAEKLPALMTAAEASERRDFSCPEIPDNCPPGRGRNVLLPRRVRRSDEGPGERPADGGVMFGTMDDDEDDPRCTCESSMFRSRCPLHGGDRRTEPPADVPVDCDHCGYERGTEDCCGRGDVEQFTRERDTARREYGEAIDGLEAMTAACLKAERQRDHARAMCSRLRELAGKAKAEVERLRRERSEARGLARILAHAYQTDSRPPQRVVAEALAYPVRP